MSRDKQIEEMAKDILKCGCVGTCLECEYATLAEDDCACIDVKIAEGLYDKGYRKASDLALEVIKKVEQILTVKIIGFEEDFFHGTAAHWDGIRKECYEEMLVELAELKKKYTQGKAEIPPYVRMEAKALPATLNVKYTEEGK